MAEVLKKGQNPSGWNKVVKCTGKSSTNGSGCGTRFRVFSEDVYRKEYSVGGGEIEWLYTVCCPNCGQESEIPNGPDMSQGIRPSSQEMAVRRKSWNEQFKTKK
ncbi:MAG: hypothetical protein Q8P17_02985 [bacterium]|nr:hypothetical protein [bacterium]